MQPQQQPTRSLITDQPDSVGYLDGMSLGDQRVSRETMLPPGQRSRYRQGLLRGMRDSAQIDAEIEAEYGQ